MKSYGQFCPVAKAAELFCERWTALIIRDLAAGATRFSELRRGVPLMSPSLLSSRLKQLEAEGVVERRAPEGSNERGARYFLTEAGAEFVPLVVGLGTWGQRWARRQLAEHEIDLGLLIWSLERSVKADAFGSERSVVQLNFIDQPSGKDAWWFVNENSACELCLHDPGFDIDLHLSCSLSDMIYIVRGDLPVSRAIADDRLEVHGAAAARRKLSAWLNLSPLAAVKPKSRSTAAV